jgi:hypothetical protein
MPFGLRSFTGPDLSSALVCTQECASDRDCPQSMICAAGEEQHLLYNFVNKRELKKFCAPR